MRIMLWLLGFLLVSTAKAAYQKSLHARDVNQTIDSTTQEEPEPPMVS
jgi:hypothetical protein